MNKDTNVIFRINSDLKDKVTEIAKQRGCSLSQLITAALSDVARRGSIPLNYNRYLPSVYKKQNEITIAVIKRSLEEILRKQNANGVSKVYLFGSFSRGEEKSSSDVDLRFEIDGKFSLIDHSNIRLDLKEALGREIDIITQDPEKLDTFFYEQIRKEEICIYERKR